VDESRRNVSPDRYSRLQEGCLASRKRELPKSDGSLSGEEAASPRAAQRED
jgi:hypothetical protein